MYSNGPSTFCVVFHRSRCNPAFRGRRTADDRKRALTAEGNGPKAWSRASRLAPKYSAPPSLDSSRCRSGKSVLVKVADRWIQAKPCADGVAQTALSEWRDAAVEARYKLATMGHDDVRDELVMALDDRRVAR